MPSLFENLSSISVYYQLLHVRLSDSRGWEENWGTKYALVINTREVMGEVALSRGRRRMQVSLTEPRPHGGKLWNVQLPVRISPISLKCSSFPSPELWDDSERVWSWARDTSKLRQTLKELWARLACWSHYPGSQAKSFPVCVTTRNESGTRGKLSVCLGIFFLTWTMSNLILSHCYRTCFPVQILFLILMKTEAL